MLTATQKKTAQAIVNIFETGTVLGDYGNVTVIEGDTGHLTFGRSQTTLGSGNMLDLMQRYCGNPGSRFGLRLYTYLNRFEQKDFSLDNDLKLHNLLRATADDPVMREIQDVFFDQVYWQPAERAANQMGIATPLGLVVAYDSTVHGSWKAIKDRTNQQGGTIDVLGEKAWLSAYVQTRHDWLTTHPRTDLRPTVYRTDALQRLIDQNFWGLELPLVVRGAEISTFTLNATPLACYDGPQPGTRQLALQSPLARGLDVRLMQLGLSDQGADIKADGVFGQTTTKRIKDYQTKQGLPASGVAEPSLIVRLVG
jgi:chitosanase